MLRNVSAAGRLLARTGVVLLALAAPTAALAEIGGAGAPLDAIPAPVAAPPAAAPVEAVVPQLPVVGIPVVGAPVAAPSEPVPAADPVEAAAAAAPAARNSVVLSKRIELKAPMPARPAAKAQAKPRPKVAVRKPAVTAKRSKAPVKRATPVKSQARVLMQASGTTLEEDIPIGFVASSCTGETVPTAGEIHLRTHTVVSEGGTTHFTATAKWDKVSGTSLLTGKRFASDTVSMGEATVAKGEQATSVLSSHFIYAGETATIPTMGDDFYAHMIMHFTVSASGVPSAFVDRLESGCR
jgi:hypothetical protein